MLLTTIACTVTVTSQAQTVAMVNPNALALDTATQAAAEGPTLIVNNYQASMSIVLPVTKISGTIAGTVSWQGSNDGVSYWTITTTALTDATNVYGYSETPKKFKYYKALITQSGTSSLSYKASIYVTK